VWLLSKKQLWLSRIDLMGDKFEAVVPPPAFASPMPGIEDFDDSPYASHKRIAALREVRKHMFVNCWHMSEHESHGMWGVYCRPGDGVCIQTTYERLKASLAWLPIGLVEYGDFTTYKGPYNPWLGAWLKRNAFSYENEVRVLSLDYWIPGLKEEPGREMVGTPIEWPPEKIIENMYVHPNSGYSYIEVVNDIVELFAPALKGRVWYSSMGASPPY